MRKLKWERAGLREDMVKYLEVRDYTPADVIQAHYTEAIKRRRSDKKEDLVNGIVVIVVGEEFVDLRAEDLDGGTSRHHNKKNHHNSCSLHCWSMKDLLFCC